MLQGGLITFSLCAGNEEEKPLRLLKKVEQQVPRPPTPTIARPKANVEEKELALVLIQRIIRGRAIQSKVCNSCCSITFVA